MLSLSSSTAASRSAGGTFKVAGVLIVKWDGPKVAWVPNCDSMRYTGEPVAQKGPWYEDAYCRR